MELRPNPDSAFQSFQDPCCRSLTWLQRRLKFLFHNHWSSLNTGGGHYQGSECNSQITTRGIIRIASGVAASPRQETSSALHIRQGERTETVFLVGFLPDT